MYFMAVMYTIYKKKERRQMSHTITDRYRTYPQAFGFYTFVREDPDENLKKKRIFVFLYEINFSDVILSLIPNVIFKLKSDSVLEL